MTASCCSVRRFFTTPVCMAPPAPVTSTSRILPATRVARLSRSVGRTGGCGRVWTPVSNTTRSRRDGGWPPKSSLFAAPTWWRCIPSSDGSVSLAPGSSKSSGRRCPAPGSGPRPWRSPGRTGDGCCQACSSPRHRGSRALERATTHRSDRIHWADRAIALRLLLRGVGAVVVDVVAAVEAAGRVEDALVAVDVGDVVVALGVVGVEGLVTAEGVSEGEPGGVLRLAAADAVFDLAAPGAGAGVVLEVGPVVAHRRGDLGARDRLALTLERLRVLVGEGLGEVVLDPAPGGVGRAGAEQHRRGEDRGGGEDGPSEKADHPFNLLRCRACRRPRSRSRWR